MQHAVRSLSQTFFYLALPCLYGQLARTGQRTVSHLRQFRLQLFNLNHLLLCGITVRDINDGKNVQSKINPIWRRNHPAVRISPPNISRKDTLGRWSTPSLSVKALIGDSSPGPAFSSSPGTTPSPSDSPPPGSASSAPGLPAASSVGTPTSSTSVFLPNPVLPSSFISFPRFSTWHCGYGDSHAAPLLPALSLYCGQP